MAFVTAGEWAAVRPPFPAWDRALEGRSRDILTKKCSDTRYQLFVVFMTYEKAGIANVPTTKSLDSILVDPLNIIVSKLAT